MSNENDTPEGKNLNETDFTGYTKVYTDINTSGAVWRHELVKETVDDYSEVYEIATDFAKRGCTVKILPVLGIEHPLREEVFKGAKGNKCPDLNVDGEFIDVKTPSGDATINSLDNNVRRGHKQADYVVIRILGEIEYWKLEFVAHKRFKKCLTLHTIEYKVIGKRWFSFYRKKKSS